jgi:hypothetical protein
MESTNLQIHEFTNTRKYIFFSQIMKIGIRDFKCPQITSTLHWRRDLHRTTKNAIHGNYSIKEIQLILVILKTSFSWISRWIDSYTGSYWKSGISSARVRNSVFSSWDTRIQSHPPTLYWYVGLRSEYWRLRYSKFGTNALIHYNLWSKFHFKSLKAQAVII